MTPRCSRLGHNAVEQIVRDAQDAARLDFIEKMIMQGETSMLNDMIYACVKSYEAFGRGPSLRTIVDGLMAQVKGEPA